MLRRHISAQNNFILGSTNNQVNVCTVLCVLLPLAGDHLKADKHSRVEEVTYSLNLDEIMAQTTTSNERERIEKIKNETVSSGREEGGRGNGEEESGEKEEEEKRGGIDGGRINLEHSSSEKFVSLLMAANVRKSKVERDGGRVRGEGERKRDGGR